MLSKNNENFNKLAELINNNLELPIIPWVDSEIVCDNSWSRWLGNFGNCWLGEYAIYKDHYYDYRYFDDRDEFKEAYYDFNEEALCKQFNYDPCINEFTFKHGVYTEKQFEANKKNEKLLNEYLDVIAEQYFTDAIFVNIDLPEVENYEFN